MDMLTDYRIILLFLIPIITNGYFLYRNYSYTGRWAYNRDADDFNWMEAIFSVALFVAVLSGMWYLGRSLRVSDYREQIGGFITAHYSIDGEHEESDETCVGEGEDEICTTHYYTVYHREFIVETNIGSWFSKSKWSDIVDKPSENAEPYSIPAFYQYTYVGMPVSFENTYPNYIAAMNESIFENTYEGFASVMPDICSETPDIRRDATSVYRILPLGFTDVSPVRGEVYSWNFYTGSPSWFNPAVDVTTLPLSSVPTYADTLFGYLGDKVQADIHVYVVNSPNTNYADMCLAKWKNGAKNSIYVFIFGLSDNITYQPVDVRVAVAVDGMSRNSEVQFANDAERSNYYMKLDIRNQLLNYFDAGGTLDRQTILSIVATNVDTTFVRQEMATFKEYIKYVFPTFGWMIFTVIVLLILDVALHLWLAENDF